MKGQVVLNPVAAAIHDIRQRWEISQINLARALDVSPLYLNDIERGRRDVPDKRIVECNWSPLRKAMIAARIAELNERIAWLASNIEDIDDDCEEPTSWLPHSPIKGVLVSCSTPSPAVALRTRYPTWFAKTPLYDLSLPTGWVPLVFEVCEKIDAALRGQSVVSLHDRKHFRVMQIKEKFGSLRIYAWGAPAPVRDIITEAERTSEMICLRCGNPGVLRGDLPWFTTLCDEHYAEDRARYPDD